MVPPPPAPAEATDVRTCLAVTFQRKYIVGLVQHVFIITVIIYMYIHSESPVYIVSK